MKRLFLVFICSAAVSCSDILDPLPNGHYTDGNYENYPSVIRGFIDKGYSLLPTTYAGNEYAYLECATDNAVARERTQVMRRLATGSLTQADDPFAAWWGRDYEGIYYANRFLHNDLGFNTRFLTDREADDVLRRNLQGEAYALRAWFELDLLKKFGGKASDGRYLGFPIVTEPVLGVQGPLLERDTYEKCLKQIVDDCDAAYGYLPLANRNHLAEDASIQGARAWHRFDGITTVAMKAMAYLTWASPAFNPQGDVSRWEKAAEYAAEVMKFKLEVDGAQMGGFDPRVRFQWSDPNSPEIVFSSFDYTGADIENLFYPNGFQGSGAIGITQELVDAFPMANGYPIDDPASGYDENDPYAGRDPRFYATVFYHGAEVVRPTNSEVMYTFDVSDTGRDVADAPYNSPTNYYVRKIHLPGVEPRRRSRADDAACGLLHSLDIHVPGFRRGGQSGRRAAGRPVGLFGPGCDRLSAQPYDLRRKAGAGGCCRSLSRRLRRRRKGCLCGADPQRAAHRALLRGGAFLRHAPLGFRSR